MSVLQHAQTGDEEGHAEVEWMTWYLCAHARLYSEDSRRIQFDTSSTCGYKICNIFGVINGYQI